MATDRRREKAYNGRVGADGEARGDSVEVVDGGGDNESIEVVTNGGSVAGLDLLM